MISYYTLSILAVFLYLYSFFPIAKINVSKVDQSTINRSVNFNMDSLSEPAIDRLVLIVIDALRHDFVTPRNMPYLHGTSKRDGCSTIVKVESPTVTLPRIKALTTGTVPQFIDVLLNLVSVDSVSDSFLHRAVEKGKKIVFYGDDTWLKIYPDLFLRSEGTTSFFVNDFTEVDRNVTRNVHEELKKNDWDIMILHYLGLDHIGHIYGPFNSLVPPKLQEMDEVFKSIYDSISDRKTLIAVTGDHGMKDSGGHGGTTHSETHVPLILTGIDCINDSIHQTDIPVIFSALLGLQFPRNSLGKVSPNLLRVLSNRKLLLLHHENVLNLLNSSNGGDCAKLNKSIKFHKDFLKTGSNSSYVKSIKLYRSCLRELSAALIRNSTRQYDYGLVISCLVLLFCFTSSFLYTFTQSTYNIKFQDNAIIYFVILVTFIVNLNQFVAAILCFLILGTVLYQIVIGIKYFQLNITWIITVIFSLNIVHGISMGSSSFIEEEHQTWYFYFSSFLLLILCKSIFNKSHKNIVYNLVMIIIFRIIRKLNQTGDKWSHLPDIAQFLISDAHHVYLLIYFTIGLLLIYYYCKKISKPQIKNYLLLPILFCIFILKFYLKDNPLLGKTIWMLIILNFLLATKTKNSIENIIIAFTLITTLLLRPHNVILPAVLLYANSIISNQIDNKETLIVSHLWLGNALYFAQGHSNSLASIDIATGYLGLTDYVPPIVALQVLAHTYCMPVLAHLLVLKKFKDASTWNLFVLQRLWIVTVTFSIAFALRQHLFVWSVFAPKVLIESSHCVVLFAEVFVHHFVLFVSCNIKNKKTVKM